MKHWVRRASALYEELAAVADVRDPRWWIVAGGAALDWGERRSYVNSDAEPSSDTFIAARVPAVDPIALAWAARDALRELDGMFPEQPLSVAIRRRAGGAVIVPIAFDIVAFAVGDRCWATRVDSPTLAADLQAVLAGDVRESVKGRPFVCISIGDEPLATARHGHRRAWTPDGGPWLGLGRSGDLAVVSTCHFAVDGYGHARLAARIWELAAQYIVGREGNDPPPLTPPPINSVGTALPREGNDPPPLTPPPINSVGTALPREGNDPPPLTPPPINSVGTALPLSITWQEVPSGLRALPLAYALGRLLHRLAGKPNARFSPTFQIPIAPGTQDDPTRMRRRVVPSITSVRFDCGEPEPFEVFADRTKQILAREADGIGVSARLLAAARAVPAPLWWKRQAIGVGRPGWLEPIASVIGGRGCISRIDLDVSTPPMCAVSSPARLADEDDPLGSCVVTVIDDGTRAAITLCGSGGVARPEHLAQLLALVP